MKQVVVIGAGAAGMCAAICAAREGAKVTVLEKGQAPLKKLSMTGNGRCNLSNTDMHADCYNASAKRFLAFFSTDGVETLISFLRELGVLVRSEEGYLYPVSGQATSVASALLTKARLLGAEVICGVQAKEVVRAKANPEAAADGLPLWDVRALKDGKTVTYRADAVILASGALSGPKSTLSTGDGYYIARQLGLEVTKCTPALVKVISKDPDLPKEHGVRMWGNIRFLANEDTLIAEEYGEIQITKGGLSGIPVLQASAAVARHIDRGERVCAVIDFFAHIERRRQVRAKESKDTAKEAKRREMTKVLYDDFVARYIAQLTEEDGARLTIGEALNGICNTYINEMILRREGLTKDTALSTVSRETMQRILMQYRALRIDIDGVGSYADAQATAGGVLLDDVDDTLQAKCAPGCYLTGELLDVTGRCGGYNLHFAFLSGMMAGEAAAKVRS